MCSLLPETERGLSEILGYVLVFALVLTSIGFITVSGMDSLREIRATEKAENAERGFDVVADNMASIYQQDSPSRTTELDLEKSELFYAGNSTLTVEVGIERFEYNIRPVVLRPADGTRIVYEAGAVIREQRDGGVMLREPPLLFSTERVHAPVVQTYTGGVKSAAGATVLVRGKSTAREVLLADTTGTYSGDTLTVTVASPRYKVWKRYFEEETALSSCTTDPLTKTVECSMSAPDVIYVTQQRIEVSLIF